MLLSLSHCCRRLEAKVERLAQQALGTRAGLLRACCGPVLGGPNLDAVSSAPSTVTILLAAQVSLHMFLPVLILLSSHEWTLLFKLQTLTP